jgi:hypothetical protein
VYVSRGAADPPDLGALACFNADFNNALGNGTTIGVSLYGATHTYVYVYSSTSATNLTLNGSTGNSNYSSVCLRYE